MLELRTSFILLMKQTQHWIRKLPRFLTTILPSRLATALTMIALLNLHLVSVILTPKASPAEPKIEAAFFTSFYGMMLSNNMLRSYYETDLTNSSFWVKKAKKGE